MAITYNGVTSEIEAGKTAALACNGKRMKTDVVIGFDTAGNITYNGTETAVEAGKTATLACAGKKMLSDLVIVTTKAQETVAYALYNGIKLPNIPTDALQKCPYAFMRVRLSEGYYELLFSDKPFYFVRPNTATPLGDVLCRNPDATTVLVYNLQMSNAQEATKWEFAGEMSENSFSIDTTATTIVYPEWTNHDVANGSPTASPILRVGNCEYAPCDNLPIIDGTWRFNSKIVYPDEYVDGRLSYYCDCSPMNDNTSTDHAGFLFYGGMLYKYAREKNKGMLYGSTTAFYDITNQKFKRSSYASTNFTFDNVMVSNEFYNWFTANATQQ